jgi:hypothetical protein
MPKETKICPRCKKAKGLHHFYKQKTHKTVSMELCKPCNWAVKDELEFKQIYDIITNMDLEGKL